MILVHVYYLLDNYMGSVSEDKRNTTNERSQLEGQLYEILLAISYKFTK